MAQIAMRMTFSIISFILLMVFATRLTCRIPSQSKASITSEQKQVLVLLMMLVLFNDPFYTITIWAPSIATFVFNQIFISVFCASMIVFWLRLNMRVSEFTPNAQEA